MSGPAKGGGEGGQPGPTKREVPGRLAEREGRFGEGDRLCLAGAGITGEKGGGGAGREGHGLDFRWLRFC